MSWDIEKEIYTNKLEHIVDGVTKILELQGNRVVSPEMRQTLEQLREKARLLLPKLKRDEFEIAVVGLEKAGKSSFSNAFIGLTALPTAPERCTYTTTRIHAGEESVADVYFYTRQEFDRSFKEKLEVLGIPDAASYSIDNLTLEKYKQLFEDCSEEKKKLYEDNLNLDIIDTLTNKDELLRYVGMSPKHFPNPSLEDEEYTSFIVKPKRAIAVKDVVVRSTELHEMPNAVMYDVPGFNSPTAMHLEQTLEKMKNADAIIMVAKADEPSITGDVLKIFRKSDADGGLLKDKLFVFANKADRVDSVKVLEENKKVTYEEWIEKRAILAPGAEDRIMFGSAKAHLGAAVSNGMQARKTLEEWGIPDGIDELREKLKQYYRTDRFAILKRRIDKILSDVEDLFQPVQLPVASTDSGDQAYGEIVLELYTNLGKTLTRQLEDLKYQVNTDVNTNHPLTANISDCIKALVVPEKYGVSEEKLDQYHKQLVGSGNAPQPGKVDAYLREEQFASIYTAFSDQILSCTGSKHQEVCNRVLGMFMNMVQISTSSEAYGTLRDEVLAFCAMDSNTDDGYYQSLIERFARDVFEIQIKYSHGNDRLNKFREEAASFFSLGVFYNAFLSAQDGGNKLAYIDTAPRDSQLWELLLYPERSVGTEEMAETRSAVLDWIRGETGLASLSVTMGILEQLVDRLLPVYGGVLLDTLMEEFRTRFVRGSSESDTFTNARDILSSLLVDGGDDRDTAPLLDDVLKKKSRYLTDVAKKHQNYTYEKVKEELDLDILALQQVLQYAIVPAANIDKAFSARETKMIEDIISRLESKEFRLFIARNVGVIEAAKLNQIQEAKAQRELDNLVRKEIRAILSTIVA